LRPHSNVTVSHRSEESRHRANPPLCQLEIRKPATPSGSERPIRRNAGGGRNAGVERHQEHEVGMVQSGGRIILSIGFGWRSSRENGCGDDRGPNRVWSAVACRRPKWLSSSRAYRRYLWTATAKMLG